MKQDLYYITPYILFLFGSIISILGYLIKLAINNMQNSVDKAIKAVEHQSTQIHGLLLNQELHKLKLELHANEISHLKASIESRPKAVKLTEANY